MNRRLFLRRVGLGVTGAMVLAHLPATVVKAVVGPETTRRYAAAYLTKLYNDHCRGKGPASHPKVIEAGQELFEAYESELPSIHRWSDSKDLGSLKFKVTTLRQGGPGWYARVVA